MNIQIKLKCENRLVKSLFGGLQVWSTYHYTNSNPLLNEEISFRLKTWIKNTTMGKQYTIIYKKKRL